MWKELGKALRHSGDSKLAIVYLLFSSRLVFLTQCLKTSVLYLSCIYCEMEHAPHGSNQYTQSQAWLKHVNWFTISKGMKVNFNHVNHLQNLRAEKWAWGSLNFQLMCITWAWPIKFQCIYVNGSCTVHLRSTWHGQNQLVLYVPLPFYTGSFELCLFLAL